MDLAIAMELTRGAGEHERVEGFFGAGRSRRHAAADPQPPRGGLVGQKARARTVLGLGDALGMHREPARVHLGQNDEACARGLGLVEPGPKALVIGLRVLPDDPELEPGDLHRCSLPMLARSRAMPSSSTGSLLQNAKRTRCRPMSLCR